MVNYNKNGFKGDPRKQYEEDAGIRHIVVHYHEIINITI